MVTGISRERKKEEENQCSAILNLIKDCGAFQSFMSRTVFSPTFSSDMRTSERKGTVFPNVSLLIHPGGNLRFSKFYNFFIHLSLDTEKKFSIRLDASCHCIYTFYPLDTIYIHS